MLASSYTKKTTIVSATQVVFYNALFDGVVVVEFEDAVAGSMESQDFEDAVVGSCTKKTMARSAVAKERERYHEIAEDGTIATATDVLWLTSELQMGMRSATTRICWKCDVSLRWRLSEGWDTVRRRETEGAGSDCDVKQRKGSNRVDMLRKKGWPVAVAGAIEKTNGKGVPEGRSDLKKRVVTKIYHLWKQRGPGPSQDSEHSQAPRLRGRRPRMPRLLECWRGRRSGRWLGWEPWWGDFSMCRRRLLSLSVGFQEIYSNEKEKVAALVVLSGGYGFTEKRQMMPRDRC
ncbi:hypothetical protein B296_00040831 [Ensete ventricosum]|uniref:Uncharacterized protein n=1 Tax=Ensete ventricosum TaxID=4639 RepID=A0A426XEC0_ENSVE|nr:hypothetical protein B296_00040831 [Ensete ventricosum]